MPPLRPFDAAYFPLCNLAPNTLTQPITAWMDFLRGATFNVYIGNTQRPDVEQAVLNTASYGRQLGRIGDAMAVLMTHINRNALSHDEEKALRALEVLLDDIAAAKTAAMR